MNARPAHVSGGKMLTMTGFMSIIVLFVAYSRYQDPGLLTPDSIDVIIRIANIFYILLAVSFGAIAYGMYRYHRAKKDDGNGLAATIASVTWGPKSRRIWAVTFVVYGVFFSLSSGTLVYQPEVSFSFHYGAEVPSWFISPCCADPGYMPVIIVYITDNVGLQIIPINLVLQVTVSYLVALNIALAAAAITVSRKSRSVGTLGAVTGMFVACPTCAGTLLSLFLGTAGGITAAAVLAQLQTAFIAVSIPVLLATPFVIAKKLQDARRCSTG